MTCPIESPLLDLQVSLEYESLAMGQERYWKDVNESIDSQTEHTTGPVMALIKRSLGKMIEAIDEARRPRQGRAGKGAVAVSKSRGIPSGALAFIALREAFAAASSPVGFTAVARRIGVSVRDEIVFTAYKEQHEDNYRMSQGTLKRSNRNVGAEAVSWLRKQAERAGTAADDVSAAEQTMIGIWLLDVLVSTTGLFRAPVHTRNKESQRLLSITDECMKWIKDAHDKAALFCPVRLPMVVPPTPWSSSRGGGYLTDCGGSLSLVKTRNKDYLASLDDVHMPQVYTAINAIQSTAWQINGPVLDVALALWSEGSPTAGLPNRDPDALPTEPAEYAGRMHVCKKERPDLYKPWALKAAAVYDGNAKLFSKRLSTQSKLNSASKFRDFSAIYFPHELDFRGRIYPAPAHLTPQGDDLSKSLLRFSEGKRTGIRGFYWLRVHIANCFGVDKVSFEERIAWTEQHMDDLLESAVDPIGGSRFWAKADDPFLALAACFEMAGYLADPENFESHISIPMDGSCNGLQNFSALLRDAVGGKATNLMPAISPADIYSEVAKAVAAQVAADAMAGNVYAIIWDGLINRKLVKQPVMTLPYGATKSGMRSQIEAALLKNHGRDKFPTNETWSACTYLADVTYDCIGRVVIAARTAMDWLREVAKLTASEEYPIHWTTPVGLPVLQDYRVPNATRLRVRIDGKEAEVFVNVDGTKLDKKRQSSGVSPNFIHSLDAAHLMRTVNLLVDNGLTSFAMIHDSYGVHACDTDLLHAAIREAFIEQYERNVLGEFLDELRAQLEPALAAQLPPLPLTGTLELASVREARYFFA